MILNRRTLIGAAIAASVAPPARAARLQSAKVFETPRLHLERPDWPVPSEPHQLFFIQRSSNSNMVIYTGRFDAQGMLDPKRPVRAYWRRYNTTGERMELRPFERRLAFGPRIKRLADQDAWIVHAAAAPMFPMRVTQSAPFKTEVTTTIGGRAARPAYAFITVDEGGLLPRVTQMSLHGTDPRTGKGLSEIFSVSGGTFEE